MFKRIWVIADIHGSISPIENFWRRNRDLINFLKDTDCIILLGDVGANYYLNKKDTFFKSKLEQYPFTYFCIRGNHEERPSIVMNKNPNDWKIETFFEGSVYVEKTYPYIKYALDKVSIYNINGYKTLIIPGAYSVDKYYRLSRGWSWFNQEQLSLEEIEDGRRLIKENGYHFDLILSHTCPIAYEPVDLFLPEINQSSVDKTMERYLGEIEYNTTYKLWLWGHYHAFRIYPYHQNSRCIMLSDGYEAIKLDEWLKDVKNIHKKY